MDSSPRFAGTRARTVAPRPAALARAAVLSAGQAARAALSTRGQIDPEYSSLALRPALRRQHATVTQCEV